MFLNPEVVGFESGLDAGGSLVWGKVQDEISKTTSTASYDRAGILWSKRGNNSISLAAASEENKNLEALALEQPEVVIETIRKQLREVVDTL